MNWKQILGRKRCFTSACALCCGSAGARGVSRRDWGGWAGQFHIISCRCSDSQSVQTGSRQQKSMSPKPCSFWTAEAQAAVVGLIHSVTATHQSARHTHTHILHVHAHTCSCFPISLRAMFSEMDLSDGEWRHTYQRVVLDKAEEICSPCVCVYVCVRPSHSDLSSAGEK